MMDTLGTVGRNRRVRRMWTDLWFSSISRRNLVKVAIPLKTIYEYNVIPVKIAWLSFKDKNINLSILIKGYKWSNLELKNIVKLITMIYFLNTFHLK